MKNIDVLCCGHAAYDLIYSLPSFPEENRKYRIEQMQVSGGGPAANAATLLANWRVNTAFAGVVGADPFGDMILNELTMHGVDIALLEQREAYPTPVSCILANEQSGSRTILNRRQAGAACSLSNEFDWEPKVLLFDGHELESSLALMACFPGAQTILDAGSLHEGSRVLAEKVDFLVSSADFGRQLSGLPALTTREQRATAMHALGELNSGCCVITLGEFGLIYMLDGNIIELPALAVKAIDTTAAGDIFHGAFAYGILDGWSLRETLELAICAAGLSVQRPGGRSSIPALAEVQTMLPSYRAALHAD
ncbi:hypothetical protein BVY04_03220 [bacterium M21]|nr:hypothetical protein BVY04_03220 [bacterium M21]